MKPKALNQNETGLLEYLEEIIGSSFFVEEIDNLAKQVEIENEKRIEQTNRVKQSLTDLQAIEHDKQAAVEFLH